MPHTDDYYIAAFDQVAKNVGTFAETGWPLSKFGIGRTHAWICQQDFGGVSDDRNGPRSRCWAFRLEECV